MSAELIPLFREVAPVVVSLVLIEGLLSVDNILAIAALASELPENKRKLAMRLGLAGAYVWRGVALLGASLIIDHPWLKLLGALYLIHLMMTHFGEASEAGRSGGEAEAATRRTFLATVMAIQFLDLSLSVDNVVAAVMMTPKLWVVYTGVGLGLFTLWMFAALSLQLVVRFPVLKHAAFLLVGYVGLLLIVEMEWSLHFETYEKFYGIALILAASLCYAKSAALRKMIAPLCKVALWPMRLYGRSIRCLWRAAFGR